MVTFVCAVSDLQARTQMFVVSLGFLFPVGQDEDCSASENLRKVGRK